MAGFVEGLDRWQSTLFPARLDEYVGEDNPVRAVDIFVDGLDLRKLGFGDVQSLATGRPGYHPATMLKIYIYGKLSRGFLPWRLPYVGPRARGCVGDGPTSGTLHTCGSRATCQELGGSQKALCEISTSCHGRDLLVDFQ